ncbi:MAG TPA: PAN domain-containing protein [Methyloceanibacter sp.]|nr:PAN domain-containing protein [Methyloceanibacter sp.]
MEWNTDRPGGDYHSMGLGKGMMHDACRDICIQDGKCLAYTYVKAGVQGPNPRCWLKDSIPAARSSECCISGVVRTAATQPKPQPAPASPPQSKSLVGVWDSQTGDGVTYTLIVERKGGGVSAHVGSADAKLDGTLQATLSADGKQMAFVLTQPKIGVTSRGQISLAGNGDSFEGRITKDTDGISRSWTGTRRN